MISKEQMAFGNIAALFGRMAGNMSYDRILQTYGLDSIIKDGNKTERIALTLRYLKENRQFLLSFLHNLYAQHKLNDEEKRILNEYLHELGFEIKEDHIVDLPLDDFYPFFEQSLRESVARPAFEGASDGAIISLSDRLLGMNSDFILIDFGCGEGRLVSGLNLLDNRLLSHLTYIGVDINDDCIRITKDLIKSCGFNKKIKNFDVIELNEFIKNKIYADFIFMVNVLHEIQLIDLPDLMCSLENKLNLNGQMIIHEMEELAEGELNFISWTRGDFENFFSNTCLEIKFHPYSTRRGVSLINVNLTKTDYPSTEKIIYIDNMFDMIKNKLNGIDEELGYLSGYLEKHKRFAYLLILKYNIENQLKQYEAKEQSLIDEKDLLPYYKCPQCESRNLDKRNDFNNGDVMVIVECLRCGWQDSEIT